MTRLKNLYIDEIIEKDEFDLKYLELNDQLEDKEVQLIPERLIKKKESYTNLLNDNILEVYKTFSGRKQKAVFWRTIIDHIVVHKNGTLEVFLH